MAAGGFANRLIARCLGAADFSSLLNLASISSARRDGRFVSRNTIRLRRLNARLISRPSGLCLVMNHIYRQLVVRRLVEGEAAEVVDDDVAEGSDGLAWVCRGETYYFCTGGAACVDAVEGVFEDVCLG